MIPSSSRDRDLDQMDRGSLRAAVSKCRDRIEHLELMVLKLRRDHYGPSSERAASSDQQLALGLIQQERMSDPADQPSERAAAQPQPSSVLQEPLANALKGDTSGGEIEPVWNPVKWVELKGSYSYLHLEVHDKPGFTDNQNTVSDNGSSPHHQGIIEALFNVPGGFELV